MRLPRVADIQTELLFLWFFFQLGVVVAPHALKLPEEPITRWGEYWCEVTVSVHELVLFSGRVKSWDWVLLALTCTTDLWGFLFLYLQVNGLDTIRVPMSVVNFERPKTKRYKHWLAQQAANRMASTSSQMIWTYPLSLKSSKAESEAPWSKDGPALTK